MQFYVFVVLFILGHSTFGVPIETAPATTESISPYIHGGVNAPEGSVPHAAALLVGDAVIKLIVCGGSIVLPNLILTAAHCIDVYQDDRNANGLMKSFHAVVGSQNWNAGGLEAYFKTFFLHPKWDPVLIKNDIGFLSLQENLKMGHNLKTVALNFEWVGGDIPSYIAGWGWIANWHLTPFNLQKLNVTTQTPEQCASEIKRASGIFYQVAPYDPKIEICTLHSVGHGLCFGDSGSPVMSRESGTQYAVASWALTCALGFPDVSARLSASKEFILYVMELHR